jgi:hypothetical protein
MFADIHIVVTIKKLLLIQRITLRHAPFALLSIASSENHRPHILPACYIWLAIHSDTLCYIHTSDTQRYMNIRSTKIRFEAIWALGILLIATLWGVAVAAIVVASAATLFAGNIPGHFIAESTILLPYEGLRYTYCSSCHIKRCWSMPPTYAAACLFPHMLPYMASRWEYCCLNDLLSGCCCLPLPVRYAAYWPSLIHINITYAISLLSLEHITRHITVSTLLYCLLCFRHFINSRH